MTTISLQSLSHKEQARRIWESWLICTDTAIPLLSFEVCLYYGRVVKPY